MSADSTSSTAGIALQRSSSSGSSPTSRAAAASSAGSSSRPPTIARTRSARSSGASAPGAFSRAATTARHAGSDENVRAYGRRVDRHAVAPLQAGRALGELGVLARLEREHDHRQPPAQLVAVVPAQALAHRLGGEREGTGGIGEERDVDGHAGSP